MLTRQFFSVKDVAGLLKIGEPTVRSWIKNGELRAVDVGREWRIAPKDLEEFLDRHATRRREESPTTDAAQASEGAPTAAACRRSPVC